MLWDLITAICQELRKKWAGLESNFSEQKTPQNTADKGLSDNSENNGNFKTVHNPVHKSSICPELERIITAWPKLSGVQKQTILHIIKMDSK